MNFPPLSSPVSAASSAPKIKLPHNPHQEHRLPPPTLLRYLSTNPPPKDWTGLTFQEIMEEVEKIKTTLPHQIGNSIYGPYGPQLVAGGKLQQIWQAHMAQYRPRLGIPAWQTMRLQDPSLLPCAQPPSTFPQPSREMQVGSYQLRWIGNLPLLDTYRKKVLYS
ncbi:uncharacterized protein LOC113461308 isoform X3 [Phoenix dactylifera]|uniref:Uncharacterized protein LOC113461308 isoform X3 n=1 Tax=Phoenix dactylifera TaxID=42345 RepID=A0A8B8ZLX5_PHODC|nr:uncharacterized protein LOC113461308 isoform X3 [Phoenix dactylifera]